MLTQEVGVSAEPVFQARRRGRGGSVVDFVLRKWAGLGVCDLEPGGLGTQHSHNLVSSTFHLDPRVFKNKNLWNLNPLDKCYFEVERKQSMNPFLIITLVLKRSQPQSLQLRPLY